MSTSSPAFTFVRPQVWATRLIASVVLRTKIDLPALPGAQEALGGGRAAFS